MASLFSSVSPHRRLAKSIEVGGKCLLKIINRAKSASSRVISNWRSLSLVSVSRAGGFDEACGFATLLAGIRIFDELK
jgi:hypothetical protein